MSATDREMSLSGRTSEAKVAGSNPPGCTNQLRLARRDSGKDHRTAYAPEVRDAITLEREVKLRVLKTATVIGASLMWTGSVSAQCMQWDAGVGSPIASAWGGGGFATHDDGTGRKLYAGISTTVVKWTGSSWVAVGLGFDDSAGGLIEYDSGTGPVLYTTGLFQHYSPAAIPIAQVAMLVGNTWQSVGSGLPPTSNYSAPEAVASWDDGSGPKLYVARYEAANPPSVAIFTWDGSVWSSLPGVFLQAPANAPHVTGMCVFDDGTGPALYMSGTFSSAGGVPASSIARWNGAGWSAVGTGIGGSSLPWAGRLTVFDDGSGPALYVGGIFSDAGGVPANGVAKWSSTGWSAVPWTPPSTIQFWVYALGTHDDGNGLALYVGGSWPALSGVPGKVARVGGNALSSLGAGVQGTYWPYSLLSFDDGHGGGPALWVAGDIDHAGGNLASFAFARWHGNCALPIDSLCFGDGSFAPCPCANYGGSLSGCGNSASAAGALLSWSGATNPDTLTMSSSGELPTSLSVFVQSDALRACPLQLGDGILCLGGHVKRLYLRSAVAGIAQAPAAGDPTITQRSAALGDPLGSGAVRYYQVWYRDGAGSFCTAGVSNVSNGLRVVW